MDLEIKEGGKMVVVHFQGGKVILIGYRNCFFLVGLGDFMTEKNMLLRREIKKYGGGRGV